MLKEVNVKGTVFMVGDTVKIIRMDDDNGKDPVVHRMEGRIGTIRSIDDMGHILTTISGLRLLPDKDEFEKVDSYENEHPTLSVKTGEADNSHE